MSRAEELERIRVMVEAIGAGSSHVLVLVGDAGVGKSWLCARAVETARAAGCQVVATRGIESEAHLDYAGLLDVLSPLLAGRLDRLAPPRRRAVEGALRLDSDAQADPLAVGVACLDLLAAAAEAQPLLVIVDDAHWADAASLQALRFAARRLQRDRVGVLFAARPEAARALEAPTFGTVVVPELSRSDALALLGRLAGPVLDGAVARAIVAGTGGNPLALEEAVRRLSPAQLAGRAPLPIRSRRRTPCRLRSSSGCDGSRRRRKRRSSWWRSRTQRRRGWSPTRSSSWTFPWRTSRAPSDSGVSPMDAPGSRIR